MQRFHILSVFVFVLSTLSGCRSDHAQSAQPDSRVRTAEKPTPSEVQAWLARTDQELKELWRASAQAAWVKENFITDDTEALSAAAEEKVMAYSAKAIQEAAAFDDDGLPSELSRQLRLLKVSSSLPAPNDSEKREELATLSSKLVGMYGKGQWCPEGREAGDAACEDLVKLSKTLAESRDPAVLAEAWRRWRTISPPMREMYTRFVELGNEGSREIGFTDLGDLWRSRYDMPPDEFSALTGNLWAQVEPLYQELHCYVRKRLAAHYPNEMTKQGTIPAHLLGNMWSQSWGNIYPLVEPWPGHASLDVTKAVMAKQLDARAMVKLGEQFFTSLGLDPLPETFWQRSLFTKPRDRDVVCHASAWDVTLGGDVRIKMCIEPNEEDLITIHHELGHIYYYLEYKDKPALYQDGANDGFHEAIGDAIALSVTPRYLVDRGILTEAPDDERAILNVQMRDALEKIAFLPFGKLIDEWRWDVFSGKTSPANYNQAWWALREKYQGVHSPLPRSEADFDPGAKFHIPANTPYMRYFLAHVLQFQFHKAMCEAAGHTGPLHTCSVYGNKEAGERLRNVLRLGSSRPWPEALEAMTGSREMSAEPLVEYFSPLRAWLREQNAGEKCGW
ncbi:MAG: M2 family metallopeptidase [Myxococcota bacterium]